MSLRRLYDVLPWVRRDYRSLRSQRASMKPPRQRAIWLAGFPLRINKVFNCEPIDCVRFLLLARLRSKWSGWQVVDSAFKGCSWPPMTPVILSSPRNPSDPWGTSEESRAVKFTASRNCAGIYLREAWLSPALMCQRHPLILGHPKLELVDSKCYMNSVAYRPNSIMNQPIILRVLLLYAICF